jgi:restriction system protein
MRAARMIGQIWDLEIMKDDIVALPLKSHSLIVLGVVEGNYEFKEISPFVKHTRPVKWLKFIPREQFDQELEID